MIYTALIFLGMICTGSMFGMEQAIVHLKADILMENHASASKDEDDGNNVLHRIAMTRDIKIEVNDIRELIARGADVNQKNNEQKTPVMLAAEVNELGLCKFFYLCGAKDPAEPIFKFLIPLGEIRKPGNEVGDSPDDLPYNTYFEIKKFFGKRWMDEKREKLLITVKLSLMKAENPPLPVEIQKKIISYLHHDLIPTAFLFSSLFGIDKKIRTKICSRRDNSVEILIQQLETMKFK